MKNYLSILAQLFCYTILKPQNRFLIILVALMKLWCLSLLQNFMWKRGTATCWNNAAYLSNMDGWHFRSFRLIVMGSGVGKKGIFLLFLCVLRTWIEMNDCNIIWWHILPWCQGQFRSQTPVKQQFNSPSAYWNLCIKKGNDWHAVIGIMIKGLDKYLLTLGWL